MTKSTEPLSPTLKAAIANHDHGIYKAALSIADIAHEVCYGGKEDVNRLFALASSVLSCRIPKPSQSGSGKKLQRR